MSKVITIEGKKLKVSNLDKVLYPETGFTKAQVIDYYSKIAPFILPHVKDRPLTLKRYPDGVESEFFYEKQCPSHKPKWVETTDKSQVEKNYCLLNDLPSLLWVANLASIEIHTMLATTQNLNRPTMVVFDLDPGPPADLLDCFEVAMIMRKMFRGINLKSFPKVSGGNGLHLYLPLNTEIDYDHTRNFAKKVAQTMEKFYPDRVISKMTKKLRTGKIFIDWSQNSHHKTTVAVYSLRARSRPTVSMPVSWQQIEDTLNKKQPQDLIFSPDQTIEILQKRGDLFEKMLTLKQQLPYSHTDSKPTQTSQDSLKTYEQKRNFTKTAEPAPGHTESLGNLFVIQKHSATRLHYDLRLESQGVLKSWAIPKGPSSNPSDKRLAVQTEDHPIDYKDFEGEIPQGSYGAGSVIIWDQGTYKNTTKTAKKDIPLPQAIVNGKIELVFNGLKIKGKYALVKLKNSQNQWLLIKKKDKYTGSLPEDLEQVGKSVVTGQTIKRKK